MQNFDLFIQEIQETKPKEKIKTDKKIWDLCLGSQKTFKFKIKIYKNDMQEVTKNETYLKKIKF